MLKPPMLLEMSPLQHATRRMKENRYGSHMDIGHSYSQALAIYQRPHCQWQTRRCQTHKLVTLVNRLVPVGICAVIPRVK